MNRLESRAPTARATGDRTSGRARRPILRVGVAFLLAVLALATPAGGVGAHPSASATGPVLAIAQSPGLITEQSSLTVSMELASSTNVSQVWFTFCQLTSSLCYTPVTMNPTGGNWYVGVTKPMSSYHGMNPGVRAGYNITIVYSDNSTFTEPAMPNAFANLTVARTIVGSFEFEMMVSNPVYGLTGHVSDRSDGAAVPGANVTIHSANVTNSTSTDSAGNYAFAALPNGTYTLTVTETGFQTSSTAVVVAGHDAEQNITLTAPGSTGTSGSRPGGSLFGSPSGWAAIGAIVVVAAILTALLVSRSRRKRSAPPRGGGAAGADATGTGPGP